jgi:hypothetical protein
LFFRQNALEYFRQRRRVPRDWQPYTNATLVRVHRR